MSVDATNVFYIGPGEQSERVLLDDINILAQTRKTPITEESVEELVSSILNHDEDGMPRPTLLHPPLVNMAGQRAARSYISDLNDFQGTEYRFSELHRGQNNLFNINVAGERRIFSSGVAMRKVGIPRHLMGIEVNPRYDMSFGDAILLQMGENTHSQLSAVEEAKAIQYAYIDGLKKGRYQNGADLVRALPYSEKKVRGALIYCELPEEIRTMVEGHPGDEDQGIMERTPSLSYGKAVALGALQRVIEQQRIRQGDTPEQITEIVRMRLMAEATHILNKKWGLEKATEYIQGQKNSILVSFTMDSLFDMKAGRRATVERADRAYAELTGDILNRSLGHLVSGMGVVKLATLSEEQRRGLLNQFEQLEVVRKQLMLGETVIRHGEAQLFDISAHTTDETFDGLGA